MLYMKSNRNHFYPNTHSQWRERKRNGNKETINTKVNAILRETFIQAMSMAKSGLADMNNEHVRTD